MASSAAPTTTATRAGRRSTRRVTRYHAVPGRSASAGSWRTQRRGVNASMRCPSTASSAGSSVSVTSAAESGTAMPASPIERRNVCGNTSREARAAATVSALNTTVRPAVRTVAPTASRDPRPRAISSRKRDTSSRL